MLRYCKDGGDVAGVPRGDAAGGSYGGEAGGGFRGGEVCGAVGDVLPFVFAAGDWVCPGDCAA